MSVVFLVRHAQASFLEPNYDELSKLGQAQALRLGDPRIAPVCHTNLGHALHIKGRLDEALKHLQEAVRLARDRGVNLRLVDHVIRHT